MGGVRGVSSRLVHTSRGKHPWMQRVFQAFFLVLAPLSAGLSPRKGCTGGAHPEAPVPRHPRRDTHSEPWCCTQVSAQPGSAPTGNIKL
jgi:hypothetical protein